MFNLLDRLMHSENYTEREIQESIEHFWPCLFPRHRLYPELKNVVMPSTWKPDLLAAETESEYGSILIVELKGHPPDASLAAAIEQVVNYGQRYHEAHPRECVRLAVIGSWRQARLFPVINQDGYSIPVFSLQYIGEKLATLADNVLPWICMPPVGSTRTQMEEAIFQVPAVTGTLERV